MFHSTAIDSDEIDLLSRAQAIMTNIKELVDGKLELADHYAANQEIQRLILDDVSGSSVDHLPLFTSLSSNTFFFNSQHFVRNHFNYIMPHDFWFTGALFLVSH